MQEIADHAGVTKALLHYHFRSKAERARRVALHRLVFCSWHLPDDGVRSLVGRQGRPSGGTPDARKAARTDRQAREGEKDRTGVSRSVLDHTRRQLPAPKAEFSTLTRSCVTQPSGVRKTISLQHYACKTPWVDSSARQSMISTTPPRAYIDDCKSPVCAKPKRSIRYCVTIPRRGPPAVDHCARHTTAKRRKD